MFTPVPSYSSPYKKTYPTLLHLTWLSSTGRKKYRVFGDGGKCSTRKVFDTESVRHGKCSTRKVFDTESVRHGKCSTRKLVDNVGISGAVRLGFVGQLSCRSLSYISNDRWKLRNVALTAGFAFTAAPGGKGTCVPWLSHSLKSLKSAKDARLPHGTSSSGSSRRLPPLVAPSPVSLCDSSAFSDVSIASPPEITNSFSKRLHVLICAKTSSQVFPYAFLPAQYT